MAKPHQRKYSWPIYFRQCVKGQSPWLFWNYLDVNPGESGCASSKALTDTSARNGLAQISSNSFLVHFFQHLSVL